MRKRILTGAILGLVAAGSEAALFGRLPSTPGGSDYQAYYDADLGITWQADANLSLTQSFGVPTDSGSFPPNGKVSLYNGSMYWSTAQLWIAGMNAANYLGFNDWRLPRIVDTGPPGCDAAPSGTDCAYNVDLSTSEMADLYYRTLGNAGYCSPSNVCNQPGWGLINTGPFSNIQTSRPYWSGTIYAPDTTRSWTFDFEDGGQNSYPPGPLFVWAVRTGDIAAVPLPAAPWLIAPALGLIAPWVKRRQLAG